MKKILLAAVAIISVGAASSSFADGYGTSYTTTVQKHYAPTYVVQKQVVTYPVHVQKKVIIQQPCVTYVKPCVQTYKVHTPVYYNTYNYDYGHNYNYKPACGYNYNYYTPSCGGY